MTPMPVGFRQPNPVGVGRGEDQSRRICCCRCVETDAGVRFGYRKPRLSNSNEGSEDEVDYDRTPVRKTNVAPVRSAPTRAA